MKLKPIVETASGKLSTRFGCLYGMFGLFGGIDGIDGVLYLYVISGSDSGSGAALAVTATARGGLPADRIVDCSRTVLVSSRMR